ncbi:MAG: hypothetical protein AAFR17_18790 [Pseudomonadota bacterium]
MPNYDGGHYFLTVLSPIKVNEQPGEQPLAQPDATPPVKPRETYMLRIQRALASLPTAQQSPATIKIAEPDPTGIVSPFAKTSRTHLARFVVIENAIYNGRNPVDAVLASVGIKPQPTDPQQVDKLPCPYLMLAVDFDAITEAGADLRSDLSGDDQDKVRDDYLRELWSTSSVELQAIYENCQGFPETPSADDFVTYIKRCQIETWMPFNDYYIDGETALLPTLPFKAFLAILVLPALAFILGGLSWLTGMGTVFGYPAGSTAVLGGVALAAALYGIYRFILAQGQKPWPAAKSGDLASVLKGLYLQQKFADFVIENQGKEGADLHAAFGQFIADHKPDDKLAPTQAPGVIKS